MRKWIRRGINVATALVMLAILVKGPNPSRLGWMIQFALFGLAGFNAGWYVCESYARDMAEKAISGALKSNRPIRVTRWTIPPQD